MGRVRGRGGGVGVGGMSVIMTFLYQKFAGDDVCKDKCYN